MIQLERLRDKSRRVTEITEVVGFEDGEIRLNPLFVFKEKQENNMIREESTYAAGEPRVLGGLVPSGNKLVHRKKLEAAAVQLGEAL